MEGMSGLDRFIESPLPKPDDAEQLVNNSRLRAGSDSIAKSRATSARFRAVFEDTRNPQRPAAWSPFCNEILAEMEQTMLKAQRIGEALQKTKAVRASLHVNTTSSTTTVDVFGSSPSTSSQIEALRRSAGLPGMAQPLSPPHASEPPGSVSTEVVGGDSRELWPTSPPVSRTQSPPRTPHRATSSLPPKKRPLMVSDPVASSLQPPPVKQKPTTDNHHRCDLNRRTNAILGYRTVVVMNSLPAAPCKKPTKSGRNHFNR